MTGRPDIQAEVDKLAADGIQVTWKLVQLASPRWPGTDVTYDDHLYVHVVRSVYDPQCTAAKVLGALLKVTTQVHIN